MDLEPHLPARIRARLTATTVVMAVLVASVLVAGLLAWQAIAAARQREAVSAAMLREYAQLAAWEFSREARKDIDMALVRTLSAHVHAGRGSDAGACDCAAIAAVDHQFEISPDGVVLSRSAAMTPALRAQVARAARTESGALPEAGLRFARLAPDDSRLLVLRWEPHSGPRGAHLGVILQADALEPVLARMHRRVTLLPPLLAAGRDPRTLVHLRVLDRHGAEVFASRDTTAGPHSVITDLLPNTTLGLRVTAAMTPAFVAGLGPEHGAGPGPLLVVGLVAVNGLLVGIGLWQLARERELARVRADFVAGVSHELRTPLAQIRMFAETLLLDRIRTPHEGRRALEIIGRETRRLGQLVENVLYFHRHERVPPVAAEDDVDLAALVQEVVDGFAPLAAARRTQLHVHGGATGAIVRGSADNLRQVLLNLLDNAVKFGPPGQIVAVSLEQHDDVAHLAVEDHGPGIPAAERRRIFRAFERGRATHGAGGAGIGLAVVSQIVRAHGGRVAVEATPHGGARFVVTLPAAARREAPGPLTLAG